MGPPHEVSKGGGIMLVSTYLLLFISLMFGLIFIGAFIWGVKTGQFTDIEEPKYQMMRDDDDYSINKNQKNQENK